MARFWSSFRNARDLAIVGLMLLHGLRSVEVLAMNRDDVLLSEGQLRVRGKGNKLRLLPLAPETTQLIDPNWSPKGDRIAFSPTSDHPLGNKLHHGGSGTTHSAARTGAPSVVLPFAAVQFFWAEQSLHTLNQRPTSVVREIRTLRSVGAGGGRLPPASRWAHSNMCPYRDPYLSRRPT